ncbi:MAG: hypothetical protein RIR00_2626 [Pseudomonadota bacterium]|jgi:uncharacterized membrane protein YfcA
MPGLELLWASLALLLAYTLRGLTGFGSAMVAVPILSQFWPLVQVVPGVMLLDYLAAWWLSRGKISGEPDRQEIRRLLPFALAGCVAGAWLLLHTDNTLLMLLLGVAVTLFGGFYTVNPERLPAIPPVWAPLFGFFGGSTGALFGVSAPPYVIYLTSRLKGKGEVRATFSYLARFDGAFRIALMAYFGLLLNPVSLGLFGMGLAAAWAGLSLGDRLHQRLPQRRILRATGLLLTLLGLSLLLEAWLRHN